SLSPGGPDLASLSSLDDPLRRRLYEVVAGRTGPVSRDEAASATGIGRALAVYHLDKLVQSGLLTASYQRPPGRSGPGAGRPAKMYARSERECGVYVQPRECELATRLITLAAADGASHRIRITPAATSRTPGTAPSQRGGQHGGGHRRGRTGVGRFPGRAGDRRGARGPAADPGPDGARVRRAVQLGAAAADYVRQRRGLRRAGAGPGHPVPHR